MKMIFKIARAEFRNLFYSPIAWLIILVFYIVCGFQFVHPLEDIARVQEANLEYAPSWAGFDYGLTVGIFVKSLNNVLEHFYLFIPLLTMGVINREVNAGTIKLLYSSPIRTRDIVLGKYLGLMAFSMILLLVMALLFITGYFTILKAEYPWYLSILLAAFLLSSAFIAIGLFLSSVTNYQLVAGILTFAVFFVLQELRQVWQEYDFFRDLTFFLTLTNKAEPMIEGLITTRDVLYFIIIIATFLAFTLIKLKSTQESRSWRVSFSRYLVVSVLALTAGYFSSRPGYVGYFDVTRNKVNTIHPATQSALKELDGSPLTITLYTNVLGRSVPTGLPQNRNEYIWSFWEKFVEFYPNIHYRFENYYDINENNKDILNTFPNKTVDEAAAAMAEFFDTDIARFKKPTAIRQLVDLSKEDPGPIMELEYKGRKAFLRTFPDSKIFPEQLHISGTLRRLARKSNPKIYFTTGHYERSPFRNGEREYGFNTNNKLSRYALINMGVDVDTCSLLQHDIPADINTLVVADPKSALAPIEQQRIVDYLSKGGNAIFYGEPGKQPMLNPVLQTIGITLDSGIIVSPSKNELPHSFVSSTTPTGVRMAAEELLDLAIHQKRQAAIYLQGGANISYQNIDGFIVEPVYDFKATRDAWIEKGVFLADSATPVFSAAEGDIKKDSFVLGVQMTRKLPNKEQRIMVSGDADFMTPRRAYGGGIRNGMFSWTLYNDYPVYANYAYPTDNKLTIGYNTARTIYTVYVYIIPAIVLVLASLLLIRRKRK